MAASEQVWEHWLERLYNLRRDKRGTHERPHKPVLLLSIIDLLDRGTIRENEIPLSDALIEIFARYFAAVKKADDQPTIQNPFYYLSGDGFWNLVPKPGQQPIYRAGDASSPKSVAQLRRSVDHGAFDPKLWPLLNDPHARHQIREALIARYFPEDRDRISPLIAESGMNFQPEPLREEWPPAAARDAAFRRTILDVYDYRCAACGVRVLLNQVTSLVEAAHLIPFGISFNDKPTNGMALCPNHHWAMDRHLIAPCPDDNRPAGIWRVNNRQLDDRIEGQRELVALAGRAVIPPAEEKFFPATESLRWREEHLTT